MRKVFITLYDSLESGLRTAAVFRTECIFRVLTPAVRESVQTAIVFLEEENLDVDLGVFSLLDVLYILANTQEGSGFYAPNARLLHKGLQEIIPILPN